MKKLALLILLSLCISSGAQVSTEVSPPTAHWTIVGISSNGLAYWSVRNIQSVKSLEQFTYELKTDFVPGSGDKTRSGEINRIEVTVRASCVDGTMEIIGDKFFLANGVQIGKDLLKNPFPKPVDRASPHGSVINLVCGSARKSASFPSI